MNVSRNKLVLFIISTVTCFLAIIFLLFNGTSNLRILNILGSVICALICLCLINFIICIIRKYETAGAIGALPCLGLIGYNLYNFENFYNISALIIFFEIIICIVSSIIQLIDLITQRDENRKKKQIINDAEKINKKLKDLFQSGKLCMVSSGGSKTVIYDNKYKISLSDDIPSTYITEQEEDEYIDNILNSYNDILSSTSFLNPLNLGLILSPDSPCKQEEKNASQYIQILDKKCALIRHLIRRRIDYFTALKQGNLLRSKTKDLSQIVADRLSSYDDIIVLSDIRLDVSAYDDFIQNIELDNLILSPYGLFCVEAKNYENNNFYSIIVNEDNSWIKISNDIRESITSPIVESDRHLKYLNRLIQEILGIEFDERLIFEGIIAIVNDKAEIITNYKYRNVCKYDEIYNYISSFPNKIKPKELTNIADIITKKSLPPKKVLISDPSKEIKFLKDRFVPSLSFLSDELSDMNLETCIKNDQIDYENDEDYDNYNETTENDDNK